MYRLRLCFHAVWRARVKPRHTSSFLLHRNWPGDASPMHLPSADPISGIHSFIHLYFWGGEKLNSLLFTCIKNVKIETRMRHSQEDDSSSVGDDELVYPPVFIAPVWQVAASDDGDLSGLELFHGNEQGICLPLQLHHHGAHIVIWRARVPSTWARSYLVIYGGVVIHFWLACGRSPEGRTSTFSWPSCPRCLT